MSIYPPSAAAQEEIALPTEIESLLSAYPNFKIFPIPNRSKVPVDQGWQTGRTASSDVQTLRKIALDRRQPNGETCNFGLLTGKPSGVFVIDPDGPEGLTWVSEHPELLPMDTLIVATGGGGAHFYYEMPDMVEGWDIRGGKLAPKVDIRGTGNQVILPGSIHPNGNRYGRCTHKRIRQAPQALLELVVKRTDTSAPVPQIAESSPARPATDEEKRYAANIVQSECRKFSELPVGQKMRNDALLRLSKLIGGYVTTGCVNADIARQQLWEACKGYAETEGWANVQSTVNRGFEYGQAEPCYPTIVPAMDFSHLQKQFLNATSAPPKEEQSGAGQQKQAEPAAEPPSKEWPRAMGPDAYYGIAGDFVRLVEPISEADPNALLLLFLTAAGCWFGRDPHMMVGDTRHGTNLFSVVVGRTASARKGTATDSVKRLFKTVDPAFFKERVHNTGLSTGEGIIYKIRDARQEPRARKQGDRVSVQQEVEDFGVADKRLLPIETEFAAVLQKGKKEGNTLSQIMRALYDGHPVHQGAKTNKDSVQEPHVSLIGNVTAFELKQTITQSDISNGFGNRVLWCCAERSKKLPFPKPIPHDELTLLAARLIDVRQNMPKEIGWWDQATADESAWRLWAAEYDKLTADRGDDVFGKLTARAEAQVIRIMQIFAVLDKTSIVRVEHLKAALEVWRFCEDSVRYIFGDATGDKLSNDLLTLLAANPLGMTTTQIHDALGRNKPGEQIQAALAALAGKGKVLATELKGAGRPSTTWTLIR